MVDLKFSVLMSLYKDEKSEYLSSCLESLALQTLKPTEIILVIDGPISKELYKVITNYNDILPLIVKPLDKNVGLGIALNYGLGFCNYDYVARMDTDDICLPERFEKQLKYMVSNQTVSLLGSSIIEFDHDYEREKKLPLDNTEIIKFSKWKNPFNHMSVIFKKACVVQLGGYKHHLYMEDYNLWLRFIDAGLITHNLSDILVKARVDSNTLIKRRGLRYLKSECILYKLKRDTKITGLIDGVFIFLVRALPRIIPVFLLNILYKLDRR